jgi:phenylalanyl-tRNA synthetase beta chain
MKVSLSWLKDYVAIDMELDRLTEALTMAGLEVDAVEDRYGFLSSVVVGQVTRVEPHPNADRLTLCRVDTGEETREVVCGAPNVAPGIRVPLALSGTVFPDGRTLQDSVIRGVPSQGMICSEAELGLGDDHSGIMVLDGEPALGLALNEALNLYDPVIEIDLTPNRPDCLSLIGVAREIAGFTGTRVHYPQTRLVDDADEIAAMTSVTIEAPDLCPRYAARLVTDVSVGPSPFWLQDRLMSIGLRPINNLVDITNFVMMETGQPLHAFDFMRLAQQRIVVRTAAEGEAFTTLDEKERRLSAETLMICDGEKPVAVGGVMGGFNSEIEPDTTQVLIESAYFSPVSIRKTAKRLQLGTDASHRFERGVDPGGTLNALDRAAALMVELGGGRLVKGRIDAYPAPIPQRTISLSAPDVNRFLGTALEIEEMVEILQGIEFGVERTGEDRLVVSVPSFRVDVSRPEDLMEEVARRSGYDNIPTTFPAMPAETREPNPRVSVRARVRDLMAGFGFREAINYSFVHAESADRLNLSGDDRRRNVVVIQNPLSEEQSVMRTSLVPGLLETMGRNTAQQIKSLRLFEVGKVFVNRGTDDLPEETEMLAGLWTGARSEAGWLEKETSADFYDMKGAVESLLIALDVTGAGFTLLRQEDCSFTRPGHTAEVRVDGQVLGLVGEVHPKVLKAYNLKQTAFIFDLDLDLLRGRIPDSVPYRPVPKYPAVPRDITLIIERQIEAGGVVERIWRMEEPLVESLMLFDVFEGDPIPAGKKSVSIRVTYRSSTKTLEEGEVGQVHQSITQRLISAYNADLPG